jgi:glutaminyl-peptide cyclotransferase
MIQVGTFRTPLSDGWGITKHGNLMVLSDGSAQLIWVDPAKNFKEVKRVTVQDRQQSIGYLNEVSQVAGALAASSSGALSDRLPWAAAEQGCFIFRLQAAGGG